MPLQIYTTMAENSDFKEAVALFEKADKLMLDQREKALPLAIKAFEMLAPFNDSYYTYAALKLLFSESMAHGGNWADTFIAQLQGYLQKYDAATYPVLHQEAKHFIAQTYRYIGQTEKSAVLYKACIDESNHLNYKDYGYVEMLIGITFNYMLLADYESAYHTIVKAEAMASTEKRPLQLATVYYYRAGIDRQLSANYDAVLYLVKASRLAAQTGELMLTTAIGEELASTLYSIGKERYAIRLYEKTLKQGVDAYASALECAESLFSAYELRQSLPDMKRVHAIMQRIMKEWSNPGYDALFLRQKLALAQLENDNTVAAESAAMLAQAIGNIFTNRDKLKCLLSLALHYEKTMQWPQAVGYYKQHYEVSRLEQTTIVAERIKSQQIQKRINSIKEEKERVENLANARRDFFSQVSHEIRSPMNAVIALSGLLADEPMEEGQKQKVRIIKRSSENLLGMINDLLDNAKIEAGKFTIESVVFTLPELLSDVVSLFGHKAKEKNIALAFDCPADLPAYVLGDPTRLRQILVNLLNNAIKFTTRGSVTLKVEQKATGQPDKTTLHFIVHDTGIGIAKEKLGSIFSGYTQASEGTARLYGGTGLGLKISKDLAHLMGGTLTVQSQYGAGSTFNFALPLAIATAPQTITQQALTYTGTQQFKFLIADDLEDNRFALSMLLKHIFPNCFIALADNGKEAIECALVSAYDLIIMDIDMPVMNGIEAALKILDRNPGQKIIGASANVILNAQDLQQYGFTAFIAKPFTKNEFAETLLALLAR